MVKVRLNESQRQMRAIREGVNFVIPLNICTMLSWQMIEARATGAKSLDIAKLKSITEYNVSQKSMIKCRDAMKTMNS
jgi:E3 ubiquitin-protein ligase HECTD3